MVVVKELTRKNICNPWAEYFADENLGGSVFTFQFPRLDFPKKDKLGIQERKEATVVTSSLL